MTDKEICKNCKHIRRVKHLQMYQYKPYEYLPYGKWIWFNICTLFINEPKGWGITVTESDRCECFEEA